MKRYFDLHIHPSFKPYLSGYDLEDKANAWKVFRHPVGIIGSQGSLEQMREGGVHIGVNPLYGLEKVLTSAFLTRHVAPIVTLLNAEVINESATTSYFDSIMAELAFFERWTDYKSEEGQTFRIINSIDEAEEGKVNIILAIEGGHNLEKTNYRLRETLNLLKEGPHRYLYLTMTHMIQFPLCTHAYGMKMLKKADALKPRGFGITDLGREIIDEAYRQSDTARRIHVDVKHMSLISRRQFYEYRREKGYQDIPILATHMGTTGISYDPDTLKEYIVERDVKAARGYVQVTYEQPRGIGCTSSDRDDHTYFNPWSINLYNEEISEIIDSGGLIGLNLDQRIQGAAKIKGEFFSIEEFDAVLENRIHPRRDDDFVEEEAEVEEEMERGLFRTNQRKHLRHLCNNILNIVRHGGERSWQQICIGSDFDGLIDPINTCVNATEFERLEERMADTLREMIAESRREDPSAEYFEGDLDQHVRDIMYTNGVRFLQKNFA